MEELELTNRFPLERFYYDYIGAWESRGEPRKGLLGNSFSEPVE